MDTPLRRWRISKGVTQAELAAQCGIKQNMISRYERDEHIPVRDHLEQLIKVRGLPTDALVRPECFLAEHPDFLTPPSPAEPPKRGRPCKA
jgi:transcriptional regulator with XRE-family HTH domain